MHVKFGRQVFRDTITHCLAIIGFPKKVRVGVKIAEV